jgi:hypothetical protein
MTPKQLVRISNIIGIVAILLLVYWVFSFVTIEVFGLKVFKKNMTETFYLSVLGILALMAGALIINVMFNLTRIAQKYDNTEVESKPNKKIFLILLLLFPIIASLLYLGDFVTKQKKEKLLVQSAKSIIENNKVKSEKLLEYSFSENYINESANILELYTKTDTYFPEVSIIVKDTVDNSPVYLSINSYSSENPKDTIPARKQDYIRKTTKIEREYLETVFNQNNNEKRYTSSDGNYELFYPYIKNNKKIVLYFSDYQRYGK